MGPEILIVGERTHRGELVPRVQDLGYSVSPVRERELLLRVSQSAGPVAVIVCLGGTETTEMVRALRRSPAGASVPVLLYGRLQGEIRELADVLELGADHFLEAPVADGELIAALAALVGPPQVEARPKLAQESEGRSGTGLSELHRTLEVLAARLETREESVDRDDLEAMGLDAVPDVDPEHDSGELEVLRETTQRLPEPRSRSRTGEAAPSKARRWGVARELTKPRGEEISMTPARRAADANSERTATIATEAREDVRKDRSTRGRAVGSDNRFEGTGSKEQVTGAGEAATAIAPGRSERTWPKGQDLAGASAETGRSERTWPKGQELAEASAETGRSERRGPARRDETGSSATEVIAPPAKGQAPAAAETASAGGWRIERTWPKGQDVRARDTGPSDGGPVRAEDAERGSSRSRGQGVGPGDETIRLSSRSSERESGQETDRGSARPGEAHRPRWGDAVQWTPSRAVREREAESDGEMSSRTGSERSEENGRPRGERGARARAEMPARTGGDRGARVDGELSSRTGGDRGARSEGEMSSRTGGERGPHVEDEISFRTGRALGRAVVDGEMSSRTGSERGRAALGAAPRLLAMGPARARGEAEGPELLARLRRERFTGCLQLVGRGQPERRVWWSEGQVIGGASASDGESVLGRLAARGLIGASQLELATRWNSGDARRDLERLAQAGLIKPGEMQEALREPVRRVVERVAEAGTIAWALHPDEVPPVQVELGVPLTALIAGGVRRGMSRAQLLESVGDARRPRLSFAGPEALAAELRWPELVAITGRFDARTSVGELIAEAVADEEDVRAAVHVLGLLGHLAPEVDDPEATLAAVDRRRVRERLRMARESDYFALLGLPRAATRAEVLRAHADLTATFRDGLEPNSKVELAEEVAELLAALDEARDVLTDDALHTAYLAQLEARR